MTTPLPHPRLTPRLREALRDATRVAVLGVGSELRGDDVAGIMVAQQVADWVEACHHPRLRGFVGHAAPENLTGEIKAFKPSHLVVVDAAHLGQGAGSVDIIPAERIGGVSFSTHTLPMPIIIDYLVQSTGCVPLVVGIEPQHKNVVQPPSAVVVEAVEAVVAAFQSLLPPLP